MATALQKQEVIKSQREAVRNSGGRVPSISNNPSKPLVPVPVEKMYLADVLRLLEPMYKAVEEMLVPKLSELVKSYEESVKIDAINYADALSKIFEQMALETILTTPIEKVGAVAAINGERTNEFNKKQVNKSLKSVLGIDVLRSEPWLAPQLLAFTERNVALIKSLPQAYFGSLQTKLRTEIERGTSSSKIAKMIAEETGVSKRKARLITRDQVSKFNGKLNELRMTESGITHYTWSTSNDEKVRHTHKSKNGKKFAWAKPPSDTGHPGFDVQCRCVPIAFLEDFEDEPVKGKKKRKKIKPEDDGDFLFLKVKDLPSALFKSPEIGGMLTQLKEGIGNATLLRRQLRKKGFKLSDPKSWDKFLGIPGAKTVGKISTTGELKEISLAIEGTNFNKFTKSSIKNRKAATEAVDTLNDINGRFPTLAKNLKKAKGKKLSIDFEDKVSLREGVRALGKYDHIQDNKITLAIKTLDSSNKIKLGGFNVSGDSLQGALRHELGHHYDNVVLTKRERDKLFDLWFDADKDLLTKKVSKYGVTNPNELFAESFSAWTHPNYKKGSLPKFMEDFLEKTVGLPKVTKTIITKTPTVVAKVKTTGKIKWENKSGMSSFNKSFNDDFNIFSINTEGFKTTKEIEDTLNIVGSHFTGLFNKFPGVKRGAKDSSLNTLTLINSKEFISEKGNKVLGAYRQSFSDLRQAVKLSKKHSLKLGKNNYTVSKDFLSVLRHEYGHHFHNKSSREIKDKWLKLWSDEGGADLIKNNVSKYAAANNREGFAESFTTFTSPLYGTTEKLRLPKKVEDFFKEILL